MNVDFTNIKIPKGRAQPSWCGPAALWNAVTSLGVDATQEALAQAMGTTEEHGTSHEGMLTGCKTLGLSGRWVSMEGVGDPFGVLEEEVKKGNVVILDWMSGGDALNDGHYSGFLGRIGQGSEEAIVISDPEWIGSIKAMREDDFLKVWFDTEGVGEVAKRFDKYALIIEKPLK